METQRFVMHLDLDTFFVSVERLQNPALIGKPVLVGGGSDRGVVASCSYEARALGIHSAMPMRAARQMCPQAVLVTPSMEAYSHYSDMVSEIVGAEVPVMEKASIDELYADLTGMDRFYGCYKLAGEIRQKVMRETGLPVSLALSANKTVSKVATGEAKPNGQKLIPHGQEKEFLSPLPIKKIPMVGDVTRDRLFDLGIRWVKTMQQMPLFLVERVLGQNGRSIWQKCQGIDNSPVVPYNERKSMSTEQTFDRDTTDPARMKAVLTRMTEKLTWQLRNENRLTGCITVKLRYSDFSTVTMQTRLPYTALDHIILDKVLDLFTRLFTKRMLVRLLGVRFSHMVQGTHQFTLFESTQKMVHLYQALDRMRNRYGSHAVQRAVGLKTVA